MLIILIIIIELNMLFYYYYFEMKQYFIEQYLFYILTFKFRLD